MERFSIFPVVLAVAAFALVCAHVEAQPDANLSAPSGMPSGKIVKPASRPVPFSIDNGKPESAAPLDFRSLDQMMDSDRALAADSESAISERATAAGFNFNQGKWSLQQIVCPALPDHLFLQYTRDAGTGDVSVFSASIPRGNLAQLRIITILRRSYSLFSPAPVNALTISAFNHIRAEEHSETAPDWLGTGLCYAALAGAHPRIGTAEENDTQKLPAAPIGRLDVSADGGALISFTDVSAIPRPMQWTMAFDGKGKLLKATHSAALKSRGKAVKRTPVEVQGKLVPSP
jgi:hypothetical protein